MMFFFFDHLFELSFLCFLFFFFNDTATTEIYTLSLHDALPIYTYPANLDSGQTPDNAGAIDEQSDRKSTRLNSSHLGISYAVLCLKKKKEETAAQQRSKQIGGAGLRDAPWHPA